MLQQRVHSLSQWHIRMFSQRRLHSLSQRRISRMPQRRVYSLSKWHICMFSQRRLHSAQLVSTAHFSDAATAPALLVKTVYSGTASHNNGTELFLYQQHKVTFAVNSKTPVQLLSVNPCVKKGD
jgi:hypothetical protein